MKKLLFLFLLFPISLQAQFIGTVGSGGVSETPSFKFGITTENEDDTFTLPIYDGGTYNFTIDWGDETSSEITAWNDGDNPHTYEDDGISSYNIEISGTLIGWRFDNAGDCDLMKDITQWGCFRPGNLGDWFKGCSNLTVSATDILNLSDVTDMNEAFQLCGSLTTVPSMNSWDVSNVTTFYGMFHSDQLFTQDLSNWDTGNCQTFSYMFYHCDVFNQDISGWDTGSMTSMTWMFYDAAAFNQDISGWDVSGVSNFDFSFRGDIAFDQDLSAWDITGMTTADGMFFGVTLSTANYSAMLIAWEAQNEHADVTFGAGNSQYSAGAAATARAALVANGWVITDGGQEE